MVYDHFTVLSLLNFIKINKNNTKKSEKSQIKSENNMTPK